MKTRSSPLKPKRETLLKKITEHNDTDTEETSDSAETPYPKNTPGNITGSATGAANSSIQHSAENSDMMESKMLILEL